MSTKRTVTVESADVVLIRCSKQDAARVMNSLKMNSETFIYLTLKNAAPNDIEGKSFAMAIGEGMMAFAREISVAIGERL